MKKKDLRMAITKYDQFDFLLDIVPPEEEKVRAARVKKEAKPSALPTDQVGFTALFHVCIDKLLLVFFNNSAYQSGGISTVTPIKGFVHECQNSGIITIFCSNKIQFGMPYGRVSAVRIKSGFAC